MGQPAAKQTTNAGVLYIKRETPLTKLSAKIHYI